MNRASIDTTVTMLYQSIHEHFNVIGVNLYTCCCEIRV